MVVEIFSFFSWMTTLLLHYKAIFKRSGFEIIVLAYLEIANSYGLLVRWAMTRETKGQK